MPHVFVESTWLFAFAAPAHHQVPAAADLFERARLGEFTLHMPTACIVEARGLIPLKCQPRNEANALRTFLAWSEAEGILTKEDGQITRTVLNKYESSVKRELSNLDQRIQRLFDMKYFDVFGLDDVMLDRAVQLAVGGIAAKPFDHAILAGILVAASRLWDSGERVISFCETDADLQPWDKYGNAKPPLTAAYDKAHIWVYGDFTMTQPTRREDFE